MATTNRRKPFDVCVAECSEGECHKASYENILNNLHTKGYKVKHLLIKTSRPEYVQKSIKEAVLLVLLCCRHNEKALDSLMRSKTTDEECITFLGYTSTIKKASLKKKAHNINNDKKLSDFVELIIKTLESKALYDDTGHIENDYQDEKHLFGKALQDGVGSSTGCDSSSSAYAEMGPSRYSGSMCMCSLQHAITTIAEVVCTQQTENIYTPLATVKEEQLRAKQVVADETNPKAYLETFKEPVFLPRAKNVYLDATTLEKAIVARGAFVLDSHVLPKSKYFTKILKAYVNHSVSDYIIYRWFLKYISKY